MIIVNRIKTPDGTILQSYSRHDYRCYVDANGETYTVDGGLSYLRRSVNVEPFEELSLSSEEGHEVTRDNFSWGTYGKGGDEEFHRVLLKDMSKGHIEAILTTQMHITKELRDIFKEELEYRGGL